MQIPSGRLRKVRMKTSEEMYDPTTTTNTPTASMAYPAMEMIPVYSIVMPAMCRSRQSAAKLPSAVFVLAVGKLGMAISDHKDGQRYQQHRTRNAQYFPGIQVFHFQDHETCQCN